MAFVEETDLADMLADTGVDVVWTPAEGDPVTRKGLFSRHTTDALEAVGRAVRDTNPSVLVELAYFEAIEEGAEITVDGAPWIVREAGVPMRSLLRLYLTQGGGS